MNRPSGTAELAKATKDFLMFDLGTKIVCVNDRFPPIVSEIFKNLPEFAHVYTVRDIVPAQDWHKNETCAVLLIELPNPPNRHGIEPGFSCWRFRELTSNELEIVAQIEAAL